MPIRPALLVLVLALCVAPLTAAVPSAPPPDNPPAACEVQVEQDIPWLERRERIDAFESLGPQCLKRMVVACTEAAGRQLLDTGSAATCSIGYEALLRSRFRGDFQAMLAWWRDRGNDPDLR